MDNEEIERHVTAAGFIFTGLTQTHHPAEAPAIPAEAGEIVAVRIDRVLRSTEVLRATVGQEALVLTHHAARLRQAGEVIVFADCLSLGRRLLVRELAHAAFEEPTLAALVQAIRREDERPLRERLASAALVVTGEVADAEPASGARPPQSEHDPIWWIARLSIKSVLKGPKPPSRVDVYFASSRDLDWVRAPKLHPGLRGIFLLHRPSEAEHRDGLPEETARRAYVALDPLDYQPLERLSEVERLLGTGHGGR
jgi:hypothetical protein